MAARRTGLVERSFSLLECFDQQHLSLSVSELARRSGLPINTVVRIARDLVAVGALERDDDLRYSIGLRLFELAALARRGVALGPAALPYLADLHEYTRQHALLSVRDGSEAVLLERVSPAGPHELEYRIGGRMPLTATAGGLALLAHAPLDLQLDAQRDLDPASAVDGVADGESLRRLLARIRREGVVTATRASPSPLAGVAAPICDDRGNVVAAITLVIASTGMRPGMLVPAVITAARAIGRDAFGSRNRRDPAGRPAQSARRHREADLL
jgi:DNA-binding IclR family transcriptional regulator